MAVDDVLSREDGVMVRGWCIAREDYEVKVYDSRVPVSVIPGAAYKELILFYHMEPAMLHMKSAFHLSKPGRYDRVYMSGSGKRRSSVLSSYDERAGLQRSFFGMYACEEIRV